MALGIGVIYDFSSLIVVKISDVEERTFKQSNWVEIRNSRAKYYMKEDESKRENLEGSTTLLYRRYDLWYSFEKIWVVSVCTLKEFSLKTGTYQNLMRNSSVLDLLNPLQKTFWSIFDFKGSMFFPYYIHKTSSTAIINAIGT